MDVHCVHILVPDQQAAFILSGRWLW